MNPNEPVLYKPYFVYGSLLDISLTQQHCGPVLPYTRAILHGYTREWRGLMTLVPDSNSQVTGAVYWVSPICEAALDRYEDYPIDYSKAIRTVVLPEVGQVSLDVWIYLKEDGEEAMPDPAYLETCLRGARMWNIDTRELTDTLPEPLDQAPSSAEE